MLRGGISQICVRNGEPTQSVADQEQIQALFRMTPYCHRTPAAGRAALAQLDRLECALEFDLHILEKNPEQNEKAPV
jgi:hypothetical protein